MSVADVTLAAPSGSSVTDALANASRETGVDFDYLLQTAQRESSLNPQAKSKTSSASGLFQFIEQTWLATLKAHGAEHGYGAAAAAIEASPSGRLTVADPAERQAILSLRNDAACSSMMAAEMTRDSQDRLEHSLGRSVAGGELYLAHFLGPGEAARFLAAADASPDASAADTVPKAAAANKSIFYADDGTPKTLAEVRAALTNPQHKPVSERVTEIASKAWDEVREGVGTLFGLASPPTTVWAPSRTLTLTPQVLEILSSLDPIPDSASADKGYRSLLSASAQ
jgi:hypothetical protein